MLLTQRPAGGHLAGLWEFPGGKCESGESPQDALRRELHEELGIQIGAIEPLVAVPWHYPEKSLLLHVYRVLAFTGEAHGCEGQALRWASMNELAHVEMPAADRPAVAALRLPRHYIVTPEPDGNAAYFLNRFALALGSGGKLMQLRSRHMAKADLRALAARAREIAAKAGSQLLLNGHPELVLDLNLDGIHLPAADLLRCTSRPLAADLWVGASCHNERELAHAAAIGVDFVTLGPVLPTRSHPDAAILGWPRFAELCAAAPLPAYALGGLAAVDLPLAIAAGAQGIAGISAFWPSR